MIPLFVKITKYIMSFNRYSYVMNNPLKYTDPSGYRATGPGNSGIPPEHNWNHYEHLQAPVLYIDGFRVDKGFGGYAFWMGGGARGGAGNSFSTKMFGFTGGTSASYINSANYDYWLANKGSFYAGGPRGTEENGSSGMEINLPGGSPGNSTGGVDLSGSISLPEIEIKGSYSGEGIVFGKPSQSIWDLVDNNHLYRTALGTIMTILGDNNVPTRGKTGGATKGTSVASEYLSKKLPTQLNRKYPTMWKAMRKTIPKKFFGQPLLSPVLGRLLGRAVPIIGQLLRGTEAAILGYETVDSVINDDIRSYWSKSRQNVTTIGLYNE